MERRVKEGKELGKRKKKKAFPVQTNDRVGRDEPTPWRRSRKEEKLAETN